ncbi:hypothetical protein [Cedecea lapagei]|uniref:hypothetical protein n=1 Tax=Cedecea lapagei TaxID=158823 RepID=UPI0013DF8FE2|nr:hypothetical protein [Cedecea lapagei]
MSVLSPASWSVVAALLMAKTHKVDPSSPDSAVALFGVLARHVATGSRASR